MGEDRKSLSAKNTYKKALVFISKTSSNSVLVSIYVCLTNDKKEKLCLSEEPVTRKLRSASRNVLPSLGFALCALSVEWGTPQWVCIWLGLKRKPRVLEKAGRKLCVAGFCTGRMTPAVVPHWEITPLCWSITLCVPLGHLGHHFQQGAEHYWHETWTLLHESESHRFLVEYILHGILSLCCNNEGILNWEKDWEHMK